jgi:hypothetical protein
MFVFACGEGANDDTAGGGTPAPADTGLGGSPVVPDAGLGGGGGPDAGPPEGPIYDLAHSAAAHELPLYRRTSEQFHVVSTPR